MASLLLIRTSVYFTLNSNEQASIVILQIQHGNMENGFESNWSVALHVPRNSKKAKCLSPSHGYIHRSEVGLYVFTWTIRLWGHRYHNTELLVDNNVVHITFFNPANVVDGSVTGIVVVHVDEGDDVLVRTGSQLNVGDIGNDYKGRSSFAGWILM